MPRIPKDRPWVSVNFALTWDGRISTRNRTPTDFTSPEDKRRLLQIRALADAVLVSARTAEADGMRMGMPSAKLRAARVARGQAAYPLRVLISNRGRIPGDLPLWDAKAGRVAIFSGTALPLRVRRELSGRAAFYLTEGRKVDLAAMMRTLRCNLDVARLHCEGGGTLFRSLLCEGMVDEIYLTLCPRIFGGEQAPTLTGVAGEYLPKSTDCRLMEMEQAGGECFLRYQVQAART
jgi:riboflavin-specific deaminase-like protein